MDGAPRRRGDVAGPNKVASDGIPWLGRFSNSGRVDWVEIKRGGYLELVGCVESIVADFSR